MNGERKSNWIMQVVIWGLMVHLVFVCQLLIATTRHGLILHSVGMVFLPQAILMYSLPPTDPWGPDGLNLFRLIGKIFDALPASLIYGLILVLIGKIFGRLLNDKSKRSSK
jgi:hypothetical protein